MAVDGADDILWIPGERVGSKIFYSADGFYYHYNKVRGGTTYYHCIERGNPNQKCNATAKSGGILVGIHFQSCHNDPEDPAFLDVCALRERMHQRAQAEPTPLKKIFDEECNRVADVTISARINFDSIRHSLKARRNIHVPPVPDTMSEVQTILSDMRYVRYSHCSDGEDIMFRCLYGTAEIGESLLFMPKKNSGLFAEARILLSDGTFDARPAKPTSRHLFCCMAVVYNRAIPLFYALMARQSEEAYAALLEVVKACLAEDGCDVGDERCKNLLVITDFEKAQQNGWRRIFGSKSAGCCFHYVQNLLKRWRGLLLLRTLKDDLSLEREIFGMTAALPYLPSPLLREGMDVVNTACGQAGGGSSLIAFLAYARRQWIETRTPKS